MDSITVLTKLAGSAAAHAVKRFEALTSRNDEILREERVSIALAWGAELKATVPSVVSYLAQRVEQLESRIDAMFGDLQLLRVYTNYEYEAAREAIDERRKMLAHAAAGLLDPDISVERKARAERTLRELDPLDVGTLNGLRSAVFPSDAGESLAKLLFGLDSGDILAASGCVRIRAVGGGRQVGTLVFLLREWGDWISPLQALSDQCSVHDLRLTINKQPFTPEEGAPCDLLNVELTGPHEVLRYLADDCEALWII